MGESEKTTHFDGEIMEFRVQVYARANRYFRWLAGSSRTCENCLPHDWPAGGSVNESWRGIPSASDFKTIPISSKTIGKKLISRWKSFKRFDESISIWFWEFKKIEKEEKTRLNRLRLSGRIFLSYCRAAFLKTDIALGKFVVNFLYEFLCKSVISSLAGVSRLFLISWYLKSDGTATAV